MIALVSLQELLTGLGLKCDLLYAKDRPILYAQSPQLVRITPKTLYCAEIELEHGGDLEMILGFIALHGGHDLACPQS